MEVVTECVVQTIVYISYIECEECHLYIEPQTKCVRVVCSCGCGGVKQLCYCCCSIVGKLLHVCKREKEKEERKEFIDQVCRERQYMLRKFNGE